MEPDFAALATAAATTVVTAMSQEGWKAVKSSITRLWRKGTPGQTDHVEAELERSRAELIASEASLIPLTETELVAEWQGKLRRLLTLHPELASELAAMLTEEQRPGGVQFGSVSHHGQGDIYQAGRDISTVHPRHRPDA